MGVGMGISAAGVSSRWRAVQLWARARAGRQIACETEAHMRGISTNVICALIAVPLSAKVSGLKCGVRSRWYIPMRTYYVLGRSRLCGAFKPKVAFAWNPHDGSA